MSETIMCSNLHVFEPRYDTNESVDQEALTKILLTAQQSDCDLKLTGFNKVEKKYVCDICVKCGMKVER